MSGVAHPCDVSTQEAEAGDLEFRDLLRCPSQKKGFVVVVVVLGFCFVF